MIEINKNGSTAIWYSIGANGKKYIIAGELIILLPIEIVIRYCKYRTFFLSFFKYIFLNIIVVQNNIQYCDEENKQTIIWDTKILSTDFGH